MTAEITNRSDDAQRTDEIAGCTIVARNYLSYAQVLTSGWREFHARASFYVLVIDDDEQRFSSDPGVSFLTPATVGISGDEMARRRGIYNVGELTCSLKPHLLRFLIDTGCQGALYIDADTDIRESLTHVALLARDVGVALSPNILKPTPLDGFSPSERDLAPVGIFNSGFVAVGVGARRFLQWWAERLRRDCLFAESGGMHADQRWLDWVPLYFDSTIISDPTVNVAHWNIHERPVKVTRNRFTVDGAPLRSFHFAGFDPSRPARLTSYPVRSPFRADLNDAALGQLCQQYSDKVMRAGYLESREVPYRFAMSASGRHLGWWERKVFREALLAAEAHGGENAPSPFDFERPDVFDRLLDDPRSSGLLSESALARLADAHALMNDGAWDRRRVKDAVRAKLVRGWRAPRRRWMPYPIPADQTQMEYQGDLTIDRPRVRPQFHA